MAKHYFAKISDKDCSTEILHAWRTCLVFQRWLGDSGPSLKYLILLLKDLTRDLGLSSNIAFLGQRLLSSAGSLHTQPSYLKQIFGLLCDELHSLDTDYKHQQLMLIAAAFVMTYDRMTSSGVFIIFKAFEANIILIITWCQFRY